MHQLRLLSDPINAALQVVDPVQYDALQTLSSELESKCAYLRALNAIDPLLLLGRVVLFNRKTPLHRDNRDPNNGWACLVAIGDFKGGSVYMPDINLRVRLEPGDALLLRGHALQHEVDDWDAGQRISLAHFTHQSLWQLCNIVCP